MYTEDTKWAGTDARVFVEIFGDMQNSGEVELVGTNDAFDRDRQVMLLIKTRPSV